MDLSSYRASARAWLAANLPPARPSPRDYTPEMIAAERVGQRALFDAGYAGITWPVEYGGQGLALEYEAAFLEEAVPYALPDFGALSGTTNLVCAPTIMRYGSPEFLREFIPRVLAGEVLICQFFSEPSSGSDLAGARLRATRDGEQWVLNGQKIWSTFAHLADWGFCLARTNWEVTKHRGLTWFAVPCDAPGLTIRRIRQIDGSAEFCEDFFDDVVVPDAQRIGDIDGGWPVAQTMLVMERGAGRAEDDAPLTGPGPLAPDLVELASAAGRLGDPVVRQKLAAAHSIDFVGRALGARIGLIARHGGLDSGVAAYGKLFRGTYQPLRARLGLEIGGSAATTWSSSDPAGASYSQAYLNGRQNAIAGGTNEMQRNAISERVLGMPREPSYDTGKPFNEVLRAALDWT